MNQNTSDENVVALERVLSLLKGVRKSTRGWIACCPAHQDRHPSLSIALGKDESVLLKCHAGCSFTTIVAALSLTPADLFVHGPTPLSSRNTISLFALAEEKMLPWKFLFNLGVIDEPIGNVRIPYYHLDGTPSDRYRKRTALVAKEGSLWNQGKEEILAYGLERLEDARKAGFLVLVEGESDCWTLWYHRFPTLGLPGAEMSGKLKPEYLVGIERLYIFQEPDNGGKTFVAGIERLLKTWDWAGTAYVVSLPDAKDPNELHKRDWKSFSGAFQQALDQAKPLSIKALQPDENGNTPVQENTPTFPSVISLETLLTKNLSPLDWTIPNFLPEGLFLLGGKPKQGKSWLALHMTLAIAGAVPFLEYYQTTQGACLYLALEDTEQRLQIRTKQLLTSMPISVNQAQVEFVTRWPVMDQGGFTHLEAYIKTHPSLRLIVVDTWAKFAPTTKEGSRTLYQSEYAALGKLKLLADTHHLSLLLIHHLRKSEGKDILDEITGSTGIAGAVDGMFILKRERTEHSAILFVTGRDIEEKTLPLTFAPTTALWSIDRTSLDKSTRDEPVSTASKIQDVAVLSQHKGQCSHHPQAKYVRFDPSRQAWCDRIECWDCYRLMKIGEVLGYPTLTGKDRKILIEQGINVWSRFVQVQSTVVVDSATRVALDLCRTKGIAEPDLTKETHRLVLVKPSTATQAPTTSSPSHIEEHRK